MSDAIEQAPPMPVVHRHVIANDASGEIIECGRTVLDPGMEPIYTPVNAGETRYAVTQEIYEQIRTGRPHKLVLGELVAYTPEIPLTRVRAQALVQIDRAAERARLAFITTGSGQALEYQATQAEALVVLAGGVEPDAVDAPWLAAEQDAMAAVGIIITIMDAAQMVAGLMAAWGQVGAEIKRLRRTAKLVIEAATTVEEITTAANISWPQPPS